MLRSLVCCGDIRSLISCGIDLRALTNGTSFRIAYLGKVNKGLESSQAIDHTCKYHQCSLVDVAASKPSSIIPESLSKGDYQSTFEHLCELNPSFQHLQPGFVNWRLRFPSHHLHGPRRERCQIYLSNSAVAKPRDLLPVSNNRILATSTPTTKESGNTSISAGNPFWVINALHCFHRMSWYAWIKRRYPCLPVYAVFLLANMLQIMFEKNLTSLDFFHGHLFYAVDRSSFVIVIRIFFDLTTLLK